MACRARTTALELCSDCDLCDLAGERRVTELKVDVKTRTIRESVQIELKNHSRTKHQVVVEDLLWRWHNYTVSPCQPKYVSCSQPPP